MDLRYGKDLQTLLNELPSFEDEVQALPTKLQNAENFKTALRLEYQRVMDLYSVLTSIYLLNDLDNTSGQSLDYAGADLGLSRGGYSDVNFRKFIRLSGINNRHNSGSIPDILKAIRIIFPEDYVSIDVIDGFDGSVRIKIPTTVYSDIFTTVGANLVAAGIELIVEALSSFELGLRFENTHEIIRDRDDHVAKARRNIKVTTGRLCSRYGSRVDIGMEV